jgi:hypothetical protein
MNWTIGEDRIGCIAYLQRTETRRHLPRTPDQRDHLPAIASKSENTEAPDVRTLPDLEAEDQRLKQVGRSCRLEDERCDADIDHRTNGRVFVLCDARFRGVMNWTIGEERFQPF